MHVKHSRFLGFGTLLLVACTLALTACNSDSVSGSQPKTSKATNAESKSSATMPSGPRSQGLLDAAMSKVK